MPTLLRNVAALYFSVSLDLSSTASTLTPRLWASTSALAIGADVRLYACIRICCLAAFTSRTTAPVTPPPGEKCTATRAGANVSTVCPRRTPTLRRVRSIATDTWSAATGNVVDGFTCIALGLLEKHGCEVLPCSGQFACHTLARLASLLLPEKE